MDLKICKSLLKLEILPPLPPPPPLLPPPLIAPDRSLERLYFGETDDARPPCNPFDVVELVLLPPLPIDE